MLKVIGLVSLGGAIGTLFRWALGVSLNTLFPTIAIGTLTANLIAGYLIGVFLAIFSLFPTLSPQWQLFLVTGCMGGLSTFSSFSAEVTLALEQGRISTAGLIVMLHVLGSITLTWLGMMSVSSIYKILN